MEPVIREPSCMAIDVWEDPRKQLGQPIPQRWNPPRGTPMLSLTMGEPNTDNGGEEDREAQSQGNEGEEMPIQIITIHHPNLSKMLERRQAMRGIHGHGIEQQTGALREPINIEVYMEGGSEGNYQKGLRSQQERGALAVYRGASRDKGSGCKNWGEPN